MKNYTLLFFIILPGIISLNACVKKDNNSSPLVTVKTWKMSATIAGKLWQTDSTGGSISTDSGVSTIVIDGATKGDSAIAIGLPDGVQPGTYDLGQGRGFNLAFVVPGANYVVSTGTLSVSTNSNNLIVGTFNGTVTEIVGTSIGNNVIMTNGVFRISY